MVVSENAQSIFMVTFYILILIAPGIIILLHDIIQKKNRNKNKDKHKNDIDME